MTDETGAWRADPEPLDGADAEAPSTVGSTARTVEVIGRIMQIVGGAGVLVWALVTYAVWRRMNDADNDEFSPFDDWEFQVEQLAGPLFLLMLAAIVIGLGSLCRLAADWARNEPAPDFTEDDSRRSE